MSTVANASARMASTLWRPLALSQRKDWSTVGQYAPNIPGYTRATMGATMGNDPERGGQSLKRTLSSDRGLEPALVKMESVVIAFQNSAVNTSLLLAHTARQTTRAGRE
jgi:hypothetical protein